MGLSLITIKIIANYLGTAGTGYYNTIITYLSFFITFADFGLFSVGVREIAKHPEKREKLLGNIFSIRLISALVAGTAAIAIVFLTNYPAEIKTGVLVASLFFFFNLAGSIFDMIFQVRMEMQKVATAEVLSKIIAVASLYFVYIFNLGFYAVVATVSISAIAGFLIKFLMLKKSHLVKLCFESETVKDILRMSIPMGVIFVVDNFYFKVDTLILFYFKGAVDVGIYAIAYRVLETTMFAAAFLAYSLKPLLSKNIENDKEKAAKAATQGLTFLLFMALSIVVACTTFSKEIITFLANSDFVSGAPALIILSFSGILIYLNVLLGEIMIARDLRKYLFVLAISVLAFNIITNIIFIPRYSFIAAAYTTLASEILLFVLGFYMSKKIIPLKIDFGRFFKLAISAVLAILLASAMKSTGLYFLFPIAISLGFYLFVAYILDAVPKNIINNYLSSIKNR